MSWKKNVITVVIVFSVYFVVLPFSFSGWSESFMLGLEDDCKIFSRQEFRRDLLQEWYDYFNISTNGREIYTDREFGKYTYCKEFGFKKECFLRLFGYPSSLIEIKLFWIIFQSYQYKIFVAVVKQIVLLLWVFFAFIIMCMFSIPKWIQKKEISFFAFHNCFGWIIGVPTGIFIFIYFYQNLIFLYCDHDFLFGSSPFICEEKIVAIYFENLLWMILFYFISLASLTLGNIATFFVIITFVVVRFFFFIVLGLAIIFVVVISKYPIKSFFLLWNDNKPDSTDVENK